MACIILPSGDKVILNKKDYKTYRNYAWYIDKDGYAVTKMHGVRFALHRVILNAMPYELCDHRNGIRLDCRRSNLRLATRQQNAQNSKIKSNNKSGYKGVFLCKYTGRYRSGIMVDGKSKYLGRFDKAKDAAKAYNKAAVKYHGAFARLNEV